MFALQELLDHLVKMSGCSLIVWQKGKVKRASKFIVVLQSLVKLASYWWSVSKWNSIFMAFYLKVCLC